MTDRYLRGKVWSKRHVLQERLGCDESDARVNITDNDVPRTDLPTWDNGSTPYGGGITVATGTDDHKIADDHSENTRKSTY
jgi:hypothetical protein